MNVIEAFLTVVALLAFILALIAWVKVQQLNEELKQAVASARERRIGMENMIYAIQDGLRELGLRYQPEETTHARWVKKDEA